MHARIPLTELDALFRADRPTMIEGNRMSPVTLFQRLEDEVAEACVEVEGISQGVEGAGERLAYEYADIVLFAFEGIRSLGLDPDTVIRTKIARNVDKFVPALFSNGLSFSDAISQSKARWKRINGDEIYLSSNQAQHPVR
jgi:hypothetical protein